MITKPPGAIISFRVSKAMLKEVDEYVEKYSYTRSGFFKYAARQFLIKLRRDEEVTNKLSTSY